MIVLSYVKPPPPRLSTHPIVLAIAMAQSPHQNQFVGQASTVEFQIAPLGKILMMRIAEMGRSLS